MILSATPLAGHDGLVTNEGSSPDEFYGRVKKNEEGKAYYSAMFFICFSTLTDRQVFLIL